jgi:DNA invertase Pin-like site-specific DNA recombinase
MSDKIRAEHRERTAYVYVRQSSAHQVRDHRESQIRQYALAERARELGFERVVIIDQDLGRSGSGSQERPGFAQLLAAVCQGLAGAVLALEASRLARNNRDWHHLIDLCAITDTLLIDADGIYDPRQLNDRLLLGLKGSLAEFELGLLRQRARESFVQKVRRGHTLWEPPVGFIRTEDQRIEKIPDRQVQEAIAGLFRKFRELGTARQTMLWYCHERVLLPEAVWATAGREVRWQLPNRQRIGLMLKNPCYAGAFAYGRTTTHTVVHDGRAQRRGRRTKSLEQWTVLILDHHPGYITWQEFLENQRLLEANRTMAWGSATGPARAGSALLVGLLRCGRCGRKLFTQYGGVNGDVPRYRCRGETRNHPQAICFSSGGLRLDQAVTQTVLEAIRPAGVQAALNALTQFEQQNDEKRRALTLACEKAQYEADRARRQYDAVDPQNRLVAGELEARWNEALLRVTELETRLSELDREHVSLSDDERQRLLELGSDLSRLWRQPAATIELKKRLLRTVLHEIVVIGHDDPPRYELRLHWKGGIHTELSVPRNVRGKHGHATEGQVLKLIEELSKICDDRSIAGILNRLRYRTGHGNTWDARRISQVRCQYRLPKFEPSTDWLTMSDAAQELGISTTFAMRLIREKILPATQVVQFAPWIIRRIDLGLPSVQAAAAAVRQGKRGPLTVPGQTELSFD